MNFRDILAKKADPKPKTPDFNLNAMGTAAGYATQGTADGDTLVYTKPGVPPATVSKGAIPYFDHVHVAGLMTKLFTGWS